MSRKVEIMDGGMGGELLERGVHFDVRYWSVVTLVNDSQHHKIVEAHAAFIKAGAKYITTSNYTVVPSKGFTFSEIEKYTDISVNLALKARAGDKSVKICGTIPPLNETLVIKNTKNVIIYNFIAEILAKNVDILLAESISTVDEADMILQSTENINKPLYLSFVLSEDGNLRDGTPIVKAIQDITKNTTRISGILFNCCSPGAITIALRKLYIKGVLFYLTSNNIRLGAYPNRLDLQSKYLDNTDDINEWVDKGITLIGGCCDTNSDYIDKLFSKIS